MAAAKTTAKEVKKEKYTTLVRLKLSHLDENLGIVAKGATIELSKAAADSLLGSKLIKPYEEPAAAEAEA